MWAEGVDFPNLVVTITNGKEGEMARLGVKWVVLISAVIFLLALASAQAKDAFSILENLETNYVGLQKKGLNTVKGKVSISTFPDSKIEVYWSREKGTKVKVEGGGLAAMAVDPMVQGFLGMAGLGMKKASEEHFLTKEKVVGTVESATLNGHKVTKLTFTPKEGEDLGFDKLVLMVDTNNWLTRQVKVTSDGDEVVSHMSYEDGLPSKIVSAAGPVKTEVHNTFVKKGKVRILSKQTIKTEGPEVPKEQQEILVTYSDVEINAEIPDQVFAEPEKTAGPKPKESAQELMQQAQSAMQQGDLETAKQRLRQIVTHYPDDPMAPAAKTMLRQLP